MKRPALQSPSLPADGPPNPAPFPYRDYVGAKSALMAALTARPFYGQVTGPSGSGKTSLVRDLSATVDRHQYQVIYLSCSKASLLGIVRFLAQALRVTPRRSCLETSRALSDAIKAHPARFLLWVDEAEALGADTLGEIRTLAESDHEHGQLFSLVLCGLPELRSLLDATPLFPLKRRITLRCSLEGLRRDELGSFLVHRFGSDASRLPEPLRDEIFERTRATVALVDRVARHALNRAGNSVVTDEHLREAIDVTGL